ncbi:MAG: glycosyltransferase [Symploca sp. SIO2C1]|nr:glycosyltransferase [Symploca sp. SIO2C1]
MNAITDDKFSISVIIPTYNRSQYLEYTLNSLVSQTLDKFNFEVVVIDDGSTDDTFQMVKTFENFLNIKFAYQIDKGFRAASSRNLGIRIADGKICMFIDSGILVKSDCLKQHLDAHAKQEKEVAIVGYIYGYSAESEADFGVPIDPNAADSSIANLATPNAAIEKVCDMRENIYQKYHDKIEDTIVPWTLFWAGHVSVSRSSLFEVGLFDENYDGNWGTEDNDLGYRLYQAGKEILLCRDAVVLHLPHKVDVNSRLRGGAENCRYFNEKFQTFETQLYFEHYVKDLFGQCSSNTAIDFHELITTAKSQTKDGAADFV